MRVLRETLRICLIGLVLSGANVSAQVTKENIETGTPDYRIIRYTRGENFTCSAMICERRDSFRCGVEDGLITVSKRSELDEVYLSYFPAEAQNDRSLQTRIRIGKFSSRSFSPIEGYPEVWVVPDIIANEDMMFELEREDRVGTIKIEVKTETFPQKVIKMRDLDGMKRDVSRLCPSLTN